MTSESSRPWVRDMVIADLGAVLAIDHEVYLQPWSPTFLFRQLTSVDTRVNRIAEVDGWVVGHAGMVVVADEGHVTTVAVRPDVQGSGIGTRLVADLCQAAVERELASIILEVRISNLRARNLYRRFGFVPAGVWPNYYNDTSEDALVMRVDDLADPDFRARVEAALAVRVPTGSSVGHG